MPGLFLCLLCLTHIIILTDRSLALFCPQIYSLTSIYVPALFSSQAYSVTGVFLPSSDIFTQGQRRFYLVHILTDIPGDRSTWCPGPSDSYTH